ncbi:MAG TPA: tRNA threonylcarbamoyladenosine dehydratase [Burkholderiaceae bacterium]|nr:tRNA threonylcarbamoyladenosine dehydratase [Burkholderiaceae bacterium]
MIDVSPPLAQVADLERRFGGLRRLYGDREYERIRAARIAVVGLGGVGSWAAEALARSGVAMLTLIDFDHVAESNINRQVQALGATLGMAKGRALEQRVQDIHPGCAVHVVDEFVGADNWPALLVEPVDAVIDACDQLRAKLVLALWARDTGAALVVAGAAGGKRLPQSVETGDLSEATHDPLLAALRQRLRRHHGAPRSGAFGIACVYSREPVHRPIAADGDGDGDACATDGSLNCSGYGSSVSVTATFGMVCASEALRLLPAGP